MKCVEHSEVKSRVQEGESVERHKKQITYCRQLWSPANYHSMVMMTQISKYSEIKLMEVVMKSQEEGGMMQRMTTGQHGMKVVEMVSMA